VDAALGREGRHGEDGKASFEDSIRRLSEIVESLEGGELPLEDSLRLFEEGIKLARTSQSVLDRAEKREDYDRSRDEFRNKDDDIHGPNRARNSAPMSTTQRSVGGLINERGPSAMNKNKSNDLETRSVLGKRFTRPGSVWIDTDYDSQATIKLSRGSEQFRALVADEPGIRTIAERLDGAIIVVWKGRAYRIQ